MVPIDWMPHKITDETRINTEDSTIDQHFKRTSIESTAKPTAEQNVDKACAPPTQAKN